MLTARDRVFVRANPSERYNIINVLKMKNFDEHKLKNFIDEKVIRSSPRFRSVLIKRLFSYYWKELSYKEIIRDYKIFKTVEVFNEEELTRYMKQEISNPLETYNSLPYEFQIVKYTSDPTQGALIMKFDHVFTDGLGVVSFIGGISDNHSPEIYPTIMKRRSTLPFSVSSIIKILSDLFLLPYVGYKHKKYIKKETIFHPLGFNPSGEVFTATTKPYKFDKFFQACKDVNISFNEFLMANISAGVKRYLTRHYTEDKIPKYIYVNIPIGNTGLPKSLDDVTSKVKNSCSVALVKLPLIHDPVKNYHRIKNILKESVGNFFYPLLNLCIVQFGFQFLPNYLFDLSVDAVAKNLDVCISNVPGSKFPLFYAGCEIHDIVSTVKAGGIFMFFLVLSYNNKLRVQITCDKLLGMRPEEMIECIEGAIAESVDIKE
jgi:hypothetical protein